MTFQSSTGPQSRSKTVANLIDGAFFCLFVPFVELGSNTLQDSPVRKKLVDWVFTGQALTIPTQCPTVGRSIYGIDPPPIKSVDPFHFFDYPPGVGGFRTENRVKQVEIERQVDSQTQDIKCKTYEIGCGIARSTLRPCMCDETQAHTISDTLDPHIGEKWMFRRYCQLLWIAGSRATSTCRLTTESDGKFGRMRVSPSGNFTLATTSATRWGELTRRQRLSA